jgi:hypothetical protein
VARRLGAAPSPRSFGDSAAQAGARRVDFENWSGQPELTLRRLCGERSATDCDLRYRAWRCTGIP